MISPPDARSPISPGSFKRNSISRTVQVASQALALGVVIAPMAEAQLEEVIVTASKRAENLQDVAVSVIALDATTIEDTGISTFVDYVRYQPNLTASGRGPGNALNAHAPSFRSGAG